MIGGIYMSKCIKVKGLDKLEKELKKMQKEVKKLEGKHEIELQYSQEEWDKITEDEKNKIIEEAQNKYINDKIKKIFK
jgi:hypothetical protein